VPAREKLETLPRPGIQLRDKLVQANKQIWADLRRMMRDKLLSPSTLNILTCWAVVAAAPVRSAFYNYSPAYKNNQPLLPAYAPPL